MPKELNLPPRESIPADLHPLVTHQYTIITPGMEKVLAVVAEWIRSGVSGATIEGDTRRGKTRCRRFMARMLPTAFPRMPVCWMLAHACDNPSERVFYGEILKALKHPMWNDGTAVQRRDRLLESIVSLVQSAGQARIVLLVDNAEYLREPQFHWLVGIFDELDERGIELFTFFFGQRELSRIREDLRRAKLGHILSRFLDDRIEFHGIKSAGELKDCLSCYDVKSQFPEGTDWSFTRYYLPDAFAKGWRLAQLAKQFWAAFEEVHRHGATTSALEIPTKHFVRSVEKFLLSVQISPTGDPVIAHAELVGIVASTGFGTVPRDSDSHEDDDSDEERDSA